MLASGFGGDFLADVTLIGRTRPGLQGYVSARDPLGWTFIPVHEGERTEPDLIAVRKPGPAQLAFH